MGKKAYTTRELTGKHVVDGAKDKRIGKVRFFVFHPTERRVLGFTVKRPDAALMFHRKDILVPLNAFAFKEGEVVVTGKTLAADNSANKVLGAIWDNCVIWVGMPVSTESGKTLGCVDNVRFDRETGAVVELTCDGGLANDALLGKRTIPANLIKGFKRGKGESLSRVYAQFNDLEDEERGVVLVADAALEIPVEGGIAAAAGKATAVVADKAKKGVGRAKGMFAEFKEEFKKAASEDEDGSGKDQG